MRGPKFKPLLEALDRAEKWIKSQATEAVAAQYSAALNDEIEAVYDGDEDQQEFEDNVKKILAALALAIFLAATGLTEDELDEEQQAVIAEWVDEQGQYIGDFAAAVVAAGSASPEDIAALQAQIEARAGYWVNALAVFGAMAAGNTTAGGMRVGTWRLGGTKEHCDTCAMLDEDGPHPVSWFLDHGYIPREADSPTLQCHGWNCDCGVYDVITGEQLL